jgi:hypothetical protein
MCIHLNGCPIFEQLQSEHTRELILSLYCYHNYHNCQRLHKFESGDKVLLNLMPDGVSL